MRKRELDKFHNLLDEKREQLLELTARFTGEGRNTVSQGGDDYVDDAVTHYTREFLLSLSDLERRQLIMVEEALGRIKNGEYGDCQMCGAVVGMKRLGAVPWARYCVSCQELYERQELSDSPARDLSEEESEEAIETTRAGGEEE
ncbi:MAG: TraR/DksA family transcriptional regulator [Acidobacteriota bacterium]|nr:TraR/DksA family transcriptional regulator [Acidobacteriota bacterium]